MEIPESPLYQMNCPPADRGHDQQISRSRDHANGTSHQPSVARQRFPGTSPPGVLPDSNRPLPPVSRAELDLPEDTQRHLTTLSTLYTNTVSMVWRDQDGKYTREICGHFKQIQQSCEDFDRSLWCKDERERKTAAERLVKTGIIDLLCDVMVKGLESGDKNNPPTDHDSSPLLISTQILALGFINVSVLAVFSPGGVLPVTDVKESAVWCRLGADGRLLPVLLTKVKEWYRPHMNKLLTAPQSELLRRCLEIILNIALCDNKGRERLRQLGATVVLTHCLKSADCVIVLRAAGTLAKIVTEEEADRLTAADFVTAFCDAARTHGFAGYCLVVHSVMGRVAVRRGAVTELIQHVQQTDDEVKKWNCLSTLRALCQKQQHITPPSVKQELLDFAAAEYRNDTEDSLCRHWAKAILAELHHDLERASRHRQLCLELGYSPVDSPDGETGASGRKRKSAESSLDYNQVAGNTGDSMNGFHSGPSTTQPLSVKRKAVMRMAQNELSVTTPHAMQRPSTSTSDVTLTQHYPSSSVSTVLLSADQHQPMNTTAAQHEDFSLLQSQNPASLSSPWHVDQGILLQSTRPVSSGLPLSQPVSSGLPVSHPVSSGLPVSQPVSSGLPVSQPVSSGLPVSQPPGDSQPLGPQHGVLTNQSVVQLPNAKSVGFPTSGPSLMSIQQHFTTPQALQLDPYHLPSTSRDPYPVVVGPSSPQFSLLQPSPALQQQLQPSPRNQQDPPPQCLHSLVSPLTASNPTQPCPVPQQPPPPLPPQFLPPSASIATQPSPALQPPLQQHYSTPQFLPSSVTHPTQSVPAPQPSVSWNQWRSSSVQSAPVFPLTQTADSPSSRALQLPAPPVPYNDLQFPDSTNRVNPETGNVDMDLGAAFHSNNVDDGDQTFNVDTQRVEQGRGDNSLAGSRGHDTVRNLEQENRRLAERNAGLEEQQRKDKDTIRHLEDQHNRDKTTIQSLEEELKRHRERSNEVEEEHRRYREKNRELEEEHKRYREKNRELEEEHRRYREKNRDVTEDSGPEEERPDVPEEQETEEEEEDRPRQETADTSPTGPVAGPSSGRNSAKGGDMSEAGVYSHESRARKHGMVRLVSGHPVYLYKSQLQTAVNGSRTKRVPCDGTKLARRLLQVFFTKEERKDGSIADTPKHGLHRLDKTITDATIACCLSRDNTTSRGKVRDAMASFLSAERCVAKKKSSGAKKKSSQ